MGGDCTYNECDGGGFLRREDANGYKYVTDCRCRQERVLSAWKSSEIRKLKSMFKKFDLDKTIINPKVQPMTFHRKGYWLWGPTDQGKTHLSGWLVLKLIESSTKSFVWGRVSIKDLFNAWEHVRSDIDELRDEAYKLMKYLKTLDVIIFEDIDKAGNFTAAREEEFFDLLNKMYERSVKVIVNANYAIRQFGIDRLPRDSQLTERDGRSPIERRFKEDLCEEVYLAWR